MGSVFFCPVFLLELLLQKIIAISKLKIESYKDIQYNEKTDEFVFMFNPASYNQKYEIEYDEAQGKGTSGSTMKLGKIKPQEYSFEFIIDGTGATGEYKDVADKVIPIVAA